jgi:hypothetical protein
MPTDTEKELRKDMPKHLAFEHKQQYINKQVELRYNISKLNQLLFWLETNELFTILFRSDIDQKSDLSKWILENPELKTQFEELKALPFTQAVQECYKNKDLKDIDLVVETLEKIGSVVENKNHIIEAEQIQAWITQIKDFQALVKDRIKQEIEQTKKALEPIEQELKKIEQAELMNAALVSMLIKPEENLNKAQKALSQLIQKNNERSDELQKQIANLNLLLSSAKSDTPLKDDDWIHAQPELKKKFDNLKESSNDNPVGNDEKLIKRVIKQAIKESKQELEPIEQESKKIKRAKEMNTTLLSMFVRPKEIEDQRALLQLSNENHDLKQQFETLKNLSFIEKLRDDFKTKSPTNEELVDAFNDALELQEVGIRDKIMNFFHICYKLIYETLVGQYNVKSTLEEKKEINEQKQDARNKFTTFLTATESKITGGVVQR